MSHSRGLAIVLWDSGKAWLTVVLENTLKQMEGSVPKGKGVKAVTLIKVS